MITRTQVRQFLAVVDGGSFTRAAALINVTQPTLSTGVGELEKHLGTKLFIREKRRIQLTEAGAKFLVHARKIQREFRLAEDETVKSSPPQKAIKLGVLESIASHILEPIIADYQSQEHDNPLSLLEGNVSELQSALAKGRIDAAITISPANISAGRIIPLFEEPYLLMVSSRHRIADRPIVSPEEVSSETMIARRSCELLSETSKFFTSHGARPPFSLRSPHDDRVMAMVRANLGITVAPRSHQIKSVSAIQLEGFLHDRTIALVLGDSWMRKFGSDHVLLESIKQNLQLSAAIS